MSLPTPEETTTARKKQDEVALSEAAAYIELIGPALRSGDLKPDENGWYWFNKDPKLQLPITITKGSDAWRHIETTAEYMGWEVDIDEGVSHDKNHDFKMRQRD